MAKLTSNGVYRVRVTKPVQVKWTKAWGIDCTFLWPDCISFWSSQWCLERYRNPAGNPPKNLGENAHGSRQSGIHYQTTGHPEDEHLRPIQRLILLKNVLFTRRTLSFTFFSGTFYTLHSFVSGLKTIRPLKKSSSLISSQSLMTLCCSVPITYRLQWWGLQFRFRESSCLRAATRWRHLFL